jgi:hypothetical protein
LNTIAQHGILTPSIPFKKQPLEGDHKKTLSSTLASKKWLRNK